MRVTVFEPKFVGHFLGFARFAAEAYAAAGCDVTICVPLNARGSPQASIKLGDLPEGVQVRPCIDVPLDYDRWRNARFEAAALEQVLDEQPTDHLVVPSSDFLMYGLLGNRRLLHRLSRIGGTDAILHTSRQAYGGGRPRAILQHTVDRIALDMASRHVNLYSVDPFVFTGEARRLTFGRNRVAPLPHPYDRITRPPTRHEARSRLGLRPDDWVIGSVGDLGARKGTELLISAFVQSAMPSDAKLMLFGLLSSDTKDALATHRSLVDSGRIIVRDEFITDRMFVDCFAAMNVAWAGYPHHVGISSTLLFAADLRRRVLAPTTGCVAWMVRRYGLGTSAHATVECMADALRSMCAEGDDLPDHFGGNMLLDDHNTVRFRELLTSPVRSKLGDSAERTNADRLSTRGDADGSH